MFVGGIHGVGKSILCNGICQSLGLIHLTASSLLKWHEVKEDVKDKRVDNIEYTQQRLIDGLINVVTKEKQYLLEGHFTLFDANGNISSIPLETFIKIAPALSAVVTDDPHLIKKRIEERDRRSYDLDRLTEMQDIEIKQGKKIAEEIGIPICQVYKGNTEALFLLIKTAFNIKV